MIHIKKAKPAKSNRRVNHPSRLTPLPRFKVVNSANNYEQTKSAEVFNSKQAAFKNIFVDWVTNYLHAADTAERTYIYVQDDTVSPSIMYILDRRGMHHKAAMQIPRKCKARRKK